MNSSQTPHIKIIPGFLILASQAILVGCAIASSTSSTAPATAGNSYYVSVQGDDANTGTKAQPFRTIGKAASIALAGETVIIHAGVYFEDVKPAHSGTADRYITYRNAGDGEVIIDAQSGKRGACIEVDNNSYLQFVGLTVRGANSYSTWPRAGIAISDGAHDVILDDITTYDNYFGIIADGTKSPVSSVTVKNSKTFDPAHNIGNTNYGIFFYRKVYNSSILNNHIAYSLPEPLSFGIEVSTEYPGRQADGARHILITGNEVDHNESQGIRTWNASGVLIAGNHVHDNGATGIQIENGSENIVVENNLSENNAQKYEFETGAWIDGSRNVVVRNNILRNNKIGLNITQSDRVIVHSNYVYSNNRGAENLYNAAGLMIEDSVAHIAVTQNTFYENGASGTERGGVNFGIFHPTCSTIRFKNNIVAATADVWDLFQDSCSDFESDYNNFYNARPLTMNWNGASYDWTNYVANSGQDAHSLTETPAFADPQTFDFRLQATSPLRARGVALTQTINEGTGKTVVVGDASYFSDGFGMSTGDEISIGGTRVRITGIDYANQAITVDQSVSWSKGDAVSFPFTGTAPDIGAESPE